MTRLEREEKMGRRERLRGEQQGPLRTCCNDAENR